LSAQQAYRTTDTIAADTVDSARKELGELEGLKPSRIAIKFCATDIHCHHCSVNFRYGFEVLWVRTRDDEKAEVIAGVPELTTWKARPWHRWCWDAFEAAVDARRVELETILGVEHHELE